MLLLFNEYILTVKIESKNKKNIEHRNIDIRSDKSNRKKNINLYYTHHLKKWNKKNVVNKELLNSVKGKIRVLRSLRR